MLWVVALVFASSMALSSVEANAAPKDEVNAAAWGSDIPATDPTGEPAAPDNPAFVQHCLAWLKLLGGKRGFEHIDAGRALLTKTRKWGLIVRVDFTINHQSDPGRVDRLICWKPSSRPMVVEVAIGQAVPPLRPPP
jgi:hypothetical protein